MSRKNHTSNRRRTAAGVGVATGAAFAAGFIGLGTAATAGAVGEDGGAAAGPTADQIQAVLSGDGVTSADFHGANLTQVSTALAGSSTTDVFGDDVSAHDVQRVLGPDYYYPVNSSDVTYGSIASDLNGATPINGGGSGMEPPGGGGNPPIPTSMDHDGFSDLFGAQNADDPTSVGGHDAALDTQLFQQHPDTAIAFDTNVDEFEAANDHPLTDLVNFLDPSAFTTQTDSDIVDAMGNPIEYLVPADGFQTQFADLIVGLDYVLTGPGLTFALNPVIDGLIFGANGLFDLGF
jgi:hypothetical protein